MATAWNASRVPSASKNSSRAKSLSAAWCFGRRHGGLVSVEFSFAPARQFHIIVQRFLRLLDKAMQHDDLAIDKAEQQPRDPVARAIASTSQRPSPNPKTVTQRPAKGHAYGPAKLHGIRSWPMMARSSLLRRLSQSSTTALPTAVW